MNREIPTVPADLTAGAMSFREFLAAEFHAPEERVTGLMPGEGLCVLLGAEKTGKSLLGFQLALCLCGGIPFLGFPVTSCNVLLVEEEGSVAALQSRMSVIASALGVRHSDLPLLVLHRCRWRLDDPQHIAAISDFISAHDIRVVVLGPLAQLADVEDENRAMGFNRVARNLADVATITHTLFVLIHHRRKPDARRAKRLSIKEFFDTSRGTNALTAAMDVGLGLDRDPESQAGELVVLSRDGAPARMSLRFDPDSLVFSRSTQPTQGRKPVHAQRLVDRLREHRTITAVNAADLLAVSLNTAKARLKDLEVDGVVERQDHEGAATVWVLRGSAT